MSDAELLEASKRIARSAWRAGREELMDHEADGAGVVSFDEWWEERWAS